MYSNTSFWLNRFGGYGFPEEPTDVETCDLDNCNRYPGLPTDLFCYDHGRFLPTLRWTATARVVAVGIVLTLIYGGLELAAQFNLLIPMDLVYALASLSLVAIPLRHFRATYAATITIWIAIATITIVFRFTGPGLRFRTVATLLGVAVIVLTAMAIARAAKVIRGAKTTKSGYDRPTPGDQWSGSFSRPWAVDSRGETSPLQPDVQQPRTVFLPGTVALIAAAACGAIDLGLRLDSYVWPRSDWSVVAHFANIGALIALAAGLLAVIAAGLTAGSQHVNTRVPVIRRPQRPTLVKWRIRLPRWTSYRTINALDRAAEVFRLTLYRTLEAIVVALAAVGRGAINCLLLTAHGVLSSLIAVTNVLRITVIVTMRWIAAGLAAMARLGCRSAFDAVTASCFTLLSAAVPVGALITVGWLVTASADYTRRYLADSHLADLAKLGGLGSAAVALLTLTWIILASQRPSDSLQSAGRSLTVAISYALLVIAAGGLLFGALGSLGIGRIHFGRVTYASTGLIAVAALLQWLWHRLRPEIGEDAAEDYYRRSASAPPRPGASAFVQPPPLRTATQPSPSRPRRSTARSPKRSRTPSSRAPRWFLMAFMILGLLALAATVWAGTALLSSADDPHARSGSLISASQPPQSRRHRAEHRTPAAMATNSTRTPSASTAPSPPKPGSTFPPPRPTRSRRAWTSPRSFPIAYPQDMTLACAMQYGTGSRARWLADLMPASYGVRCFRGGAQLGGLDLTAWCPTEGTLYHFRSPTGWRAGNPYRYAGATSTIRPWTTWRCYQR